MTGWRINCELRVILGLVVLYVVYGNGLVWVRLVSTRVRLVGLVLSFFNPFVSQVRLVSAYFLQL